MFDNGGVILDSTGSTTHSAMRFSVSLAEESGGNLTKSVLTYSLIAGVIVGDLLITCEDPHVENTTKTESTTITTTGMTQ